MKKQLTNHFTWLTNRLSELNVYKSWESDFKVRELEEAFTKFYNSIEKHIDFNKLTIEEATELRFGRWEDESNLFLFPLWIVPIIPEGLKVTSISNETFEYKRNEADNDIRFGCVAYGLILDK